MIWHGINDVDDAILALMFISCLAVILWQLSMAIIERRQNIKRQKEVPRIVVISHHDKEAENDINLFI